MGGNFNEFEEVGDDGAEGDYSSSNAFQEEDDAIEAFDTHGDVSNAGGRLPFASEDEDDGEVDDDVPHFMNPHFHSLVFQNLSKLASLVSAVRFRSVRLCYDAFD